MWLKKGSLRESCGDFFMVVVITQVVQLIKLHRYINTYTHMNICVTGKI